VPLVNLWAEREYYFSTSASEDDQPDGGFELPVTPSNLSPGIEGCGMRCRVADPSVSRGFQLGNLIIRGGDMALTSSAFGEPAAWYLRVNDAMRSLRRAKPYGNVWFRTIVGSIY